MTRLSFILSIFGIPIAAAKELSASYLLHRHLLPVSATLKISPTDGTLYGLLNGKWIRGPRICHVGTIDRMPDGCWRLMNWGVSFISRDGSSHSEWGAIEALALKRDSDTFTFCGTTPEEMVEISRHAAAGRLHPSLSDIAEFYKPHPHDITVTGSSAFGTFDAGFSEAAE